MQAVLVNELGVIVVKELVWVGAVAFATRLDAAVLVVAMEIALTIRTTRNRF